MENGASTDSSVAFLQNIPSDFIMVDEQGESKMNTLEEEDEDDEEKLQDGIVVRPRKADVILDAAYEWSTMPDDVEVVIEIEPSMNNIAYFANADGPHDSQKPLVPPAIQTFLRTDDIQDFKTLPNVFDKVRSRTVSRDTNQYGVSTVDFVLLYDSDFKYRSVFLFFQ